MHLLVNFIAIAKAVRTDAVVDAGGDRRSALHSGNDDTTSEKAEK